MTTHASHRWGKWECSALGGVSLKCFKAQKYCIQASAYVYKGILSVDATVFDIRSWTETQIVLEPIKVTCDTSTIVVDLVNEKVLMRVQVKPDTKFCADTSKGAPAKYSMELRGNMAETRALLPVDRLRVFALRNQPGPLLDLDASGRRRHEPTLADAVHFAATRTLA